MTINSLIMYGNQIIPKAWTECIECTVCTVCQSSDIKESLVKVYRLSRCVACQGV